MAGCQLVLPVLIRPRITPVKNALHLLVGPGIEIDRLDTADVDAHASVDARAADADENAQVPACPSRICAIVVSETSGGGRDLRYIDDVDIRLFFLQSEHILLGSSLSSDFIVAWFLAALSAAGLGGRRDIFDDGSDLVVYRASEEWKIE